MGDVLVTLPKSFGIETWVDEGQLPGEEWDGEDYHFYLGGPIPNMQPGDRVYVTYNGKLRGYAPLVRIERDGWRFALVRRGGAVACTIDEPIRGFRGWRYRHWKYEDERPFPDWQVP